MAIYHYKDSPLIERIEMRTPRPGMVHATIIAAKDASAEDLERLRSGLGEQNISTLMDIVDGHAAIQVRGFKTEKRLFSVLTKLGLAKGQIDKELTPEDTRKTSFSDKVRGKALFLSAIFYDLGNAAFFASGIMRGRHNLDGKMTPHDKSELMIGAAFSAGDVIMTAYGTDKGDEELEAVTKGLKRHLHKKGIDLPETNDLNPDTLHKSGALKATSRWLHSHIVGVKCLSEFIGGLFTVHASLKPLPGGGFNHGKLAAGLMVSTAWLATFLLDKPRGHQILDGDLPESPSMLQAMANNPRGLVARPLAMGNNFANLWGALNSRNGERTKLRSEVLKAQEQLSLHDNADTRKYLAYTKTRQYDYQYNVFSACSFLIAHTLFGMSGSKKRPNETDDDKSMMQDLVLLSANVLAKQPESVRQAVIDDTAEYVATLANVTMEKEHIAQAIREKIDQMTHSAWAARVQNAPTTGPQAGM